MRTLINRGRAAAVPANLHRCVEQAFSQQTVDLLLCPGPIFRGVAAVKTATLGNVEDFTINRYGTLSCRADVKTSTSLKRYGIWCIASRIAGSMCFSA